MNELIKLDEFLLREFFPPFGGWSAVAKTEKQFADFVEGEADLARALESGEAIERGVVVSALAADALRPRQDADLFVVANCGRAQADLSR